MISQIWSLICAKDVAVEDLEKVKTEHDCLCKHVRKAKEIQLAKVGQNAGTPEFLGQLEAWENQKLQTSASKVKEQETVVADSHVALTRSLRQLLTELKGAHELDPACQDLLSELGSMYEEFQKISLEDSKCSTGGNQAADGTRLLDASTLALQHVQSLEDGPEKTALMAVLEVATVAPQVGFLHMFGSKYLVRRFLNP